MQLRASATIRSPDVTTAPTGTSPASAASAAKSRARRIARGRGKLIGANGSRTVVHRQRPEKLGSAAHVARADFACTSEPVVAVRVTIDSKAIAGWNEIDAVGVQPCAE